MNYFDEWGDSAVSHELTAMNVVALEGTEPLDYLLYGDRLPRRNDGRVTYQILNRYAHTEKGGWWCSGVDILSGEEELWGCFKPNAPRVDRDRDKTIKYEHPPCAKTGVFALKVPLAIWETIAKHHGIELTPDDINEYRADLGFWQWYLKHPSIPLCLTEGAKKAGALLSAGYVAIGLPGVHGGYRRDRDQDGNLQGRADLIAQLLPLAHQNRPLYIVFDQDHKPKTVEAVNGAIRRTAYLLEQRNCTVKIITWDDRKGKGIDDLIANHGKEEFDQLYKQALPFDLWKARLLERLTYSPRREISDRYLSKIKLPQGEN